MFISQFTTSFLQGPFHNGIDLTVVCVSCELEPVDPFDVAVPLFTYKTLLLTGAGGRGIDKDFKEVKSEERAMEGWARQDGIAG